MAEGTGAYEKRTRGISCKKARSLISPYIDGQLDKHSSEAFESHIAACGTCMQEYREIKSIITFAGSMEEAGLPPDFNIRLKAALKLEKDRMVETAAAKTTRPKLIRFESAARYLKILVPAAAAIAVFIYVGTAYPGILDTIIKGGKGTAGTDGGIALSGTSAPGLSNGSISGASRASAPSGASGAKGAVPANATGKYIAGYTPVYNAGAAEQAIQEGQAFNQGDMITMADGAADLRAEAGMETMTGASAGAGSGSGAETGTGTGAASQGMDTTGSTGIEEDGNTITAADDPAFSRDGESTGEADFNESAAVKNAVTVRNSNGEIIGYLNTYNQSISQLRLIDPCEGNCTDRLSINLAAPTGEAQNSLAAGIRQLIDAAGVSGGYKAVEYKEGEYNNISVLNKESDSDIIFNIAVPENNYPGFAPELEARLPAYAGAEAIHEVTDISPDIARLEDRIRSISEYLSSLMRNPLLNAADILRIQAERNNLVSEYETLKASTGYVFINIRISRG